MIKWCGRTQIFRFVMLDGSWRESPTGNRGKENKLYGRSKLAGSHVWHIRRKITNRCFGFQFKTLLSNQEIQMEYQASNSKVLTVVFHAAAPDFIVPPWFAGRLITSGLPTARLSVSDPALSKDVRTGWFAGSEKSPTFPSDLASFIDTFRRSIGADRVVALGGSSGGFAAIQLASRIDNAWAIAMNPQTDIFKYSPRLVEPYIRHCWGGDYEKALASGNTSLLERIDSIECRKDCRIIYLQNNQDLFHLENHAIPFFKAAKDVKSVVWKRGDWGEGHVPPPKELIRQTLQACLRMEPD